MIRSVKRKITIKGFKKRYSGIISKYEKETGKLALMNNNLTERFIRWLKAGKYKNK